MFRIRSLSPVLVAAAAGLAAPALAHADSLQDEVANTTCSADQITTAVQHASPLAWNYLNADPSRLADAQAQLEKFLAKSPSARKAALHQSQGSGGQSLISTLTQNQPLAQQILDTCDQY